MFERFTERARQVVVLAQEEARTLRHDYIGTEHILLGLLREKEGLAAQVLESLDITAERVRAQVVRIVGSGEGVTSGQVPFTPRARKVLELALHEALNLGHDYIGTEHILLGLVAEDEGVAARILLDFDAEPKKIRNEVVRAAGPSSIAYAASHGGGSVPRPSPFGNEPLAAPSDLELGWRARPIALAALGASVLARMTFDRSKTGNLEPLEMQVLARLTLGPPDAPLAEPGELLESVAAGLACDRDDLRDAVHTLAEHQFLSREEEQDGDQRISITTAGVSAVQRWLAHTAPLFGRWPPDLPDADDATG
ncbi:MAG: Clp protease N-terminal domain-containing protein [Solirubrobacteraceae bacterium]